MEEKYSQQAKPVFTVQRKSSAKMPRASAGSGTPPLVANTYGSSMTAAMTISIKVRFSPDTPVICLFTSMSMA